MLPGKNHTILKILRPGIKRKWYMMMMITRCGMSGYRNPRETPMFHAPPPFTTKPSEDLCSLLLHNLEILATDNSFNCQPMSSDVKGDIPEMCSQAAVEVVTTCNMQNQGSDCLRESLKVRSFLSNFRFELLYPTL